MKLQQEILIFYFRRTKAEMLKYLIFMATNKLMSKYLPQILFFLVEAVDKSGFFLRLCQIDSCLYSNIVI